LKSFSNTKSQVAESMNKGNYIFEIIISRLKIIRNKLVEATGLILYLEARL